MINSLKRVNFSVFLDTKGSPADSYTLELMNELATKRDALSKINSPIEVTNAINIHKQIYMSGLFLHMLSPSLSSQLSTLMTRENINKDVLLSVLAMNGVEAESISEPVQAGSIDSSADMGELKALLKLQGAQLGELLSKGFAMPTPIINGEDLALTGEGLSGDEEAKTTKKATDERIERVQGIKAKGFF